MACYIPRWYTRPKTVTRPGTNRARRALTSFMRQTPLTTTPLLLLLLLIGRRAVTNWTRRTISSLFLCRKLHLFLGKSTKTAATRTALFDSNMHQIVCRLVLRPRPHWGAYSAPANPLVVFRGPTSKERKGKGREGVRPLPYEEKRKVGAYDGKIFCKSGRRCACTHLECVEVASSVAGRWKS